MKPGATNLRPKAEDCGVKIEGLTASWTEVFFIKCCCRYSGLHRFLSFLHTVCKVKISVFGDIDQIQIQHRTKQLFFFSIGTDVCSRNSEMTLEFTDICVWTTSLFMLEQLDRVVCLMYGCLSRFWIFS